MQAEDLLARLRSFALRSKSPTIELSGFIRSLASGNEDTKDLEAGIRELSFRGDLSVTTDRGRLVSVTFLDFPVMALAEEYRRVASDPALPFPREGRTPLAIPETDLITVEAKGQLGTLLESASTHEARAVKLLFPENVPAMIVPRSCVDTDLIEAAVSRISRYLQDPRNAALAESKLLGAFKGSEGTVRQALEDIVVRPRKATSTVMSPTDFSFRFWSYLSNKLVADIGAKTERTDLDQSLLQSAYLVAYACFHQKGAAERERERAADRKHLETLVRKPPYVFSSSDLFLLKDPNGAVLSAKHGRQFIFTFLEDATRAPDDGSLPFFVPVHSPSQKKDFYVQRDFIVPVFLKVLGDASDALRAAYVQEWVQKMREDRPPEICRDDTLFCKDVEQKVRAEFPVIPALSHVPLLRLAAEVPSLSEEARADLERCFSRLDSLRPLHVLLGLSRARLFREARSYLPFWQTAPVISAIARFLRRLFRPREPEEQMPPYSPRVAQMSVEALAAGLSPAGSPGGLSEPEEPRAEKRRGAAAVTSARPGATRQEAGGTRNLTEKQQLERFRRVIRALIVRWVPPGGSIDRTLEELVDRWNPLIDPGQKQDLVKDVNALTRDFLRSVRWSLIAQPPDTSRIAALAEQLAASRSLAKIGNREPLLRYLCLYILQALLNP
jgi:hypothetical protein